MSLAGRLARRRGDPRHGTEGAERVATLARRPLISLVMPTYETPPRLLREAVASVCSQSYPHWQLCVADDGSRRRETGRELERLAATDSRIETVSLGENRGISAASNAALELCRGDFVGFLDHDDALHPDALLEVAGAIAADPALDVVYTDSDKLTPRGRRQDPFLKPDYSPVYALGAMYIGHLLVVRRSLAGAVGGFDQRFDKIQDFEFFLRVSERTQRIHHIPRVLYHWRAVPGSIAAGAEEKSGVPELQAQAVNEHLARTGVAAAVEPHPRIPHRARIVPTGVSPATLSVIVPWRGSADRLERLLGSLLGAGRVEPEVIVVSGSWAPGPPPLAGGRARLVEQPGTSFSRVRAANAGAAAAGGEQLLFLADSVEAAERGWAEQLLAHAALPNVAAVGPLLVRPDGRVEQAGTAIGLDWPLLPMLAGRDAEEDGYYGALVCAREVSALSGECMLVEAAAFRELDGFDEAYESGFEDLDLCQRLRLRGRSLIYAPRPRFVAHETPAERWVAHDVVDRALFVDLFYDELLAGDPNYNPGFSRSNADYQPV